MAHNFDSLIDRKNTNCIKYDFAKERGKKEDLIPLWVADMDFITPPQVIETLINVSKHGIFGYSEVKEDYFLVLKKWFAKQYNWDVSPNWLVKTPGVVFAISMAVRAFTQEGDGVIIQRPVYYPFSESIDSNNRKLINSSLVYENGEYHIDFEDFENKIIQNHVKLFILCNPHNPVGRVWTSEELIRLGDICVKHNVKVVSDEIHADFIYPGFKHLVFANLKPEFANITVTCTAPSKTFNLAGLQVSNNFIINRELKAAFKNEIVKSGYSQLNTMGLYACKAAYEFGEEWLNDLKGYLYENLKYVSTFIEKELPMLHLVKPQGTYLLWIDFRSLNLSEKDLETFITDEAKLWLDGGTMFGPEGLGFQRINMACPRETIEKALLQLKDAVLTLK